MKYLFLLFTIVAAGHTHAQTKPIAYKSHSGDMDFFHPDEQPEDDFGDPGPVLSKIIKINDSTIVQVMEHPWDDYKRQDTIVNHHLFADTSKTWQEIRSRHYGNRIEFEGFDKKKEETQKPTESKLPKDKLTPGSACPTKPTTPPVQKKTRLKKKQKDRATVLAPVSQDNPENGSGFSWFYFSLGVYVVMLLMLLLLFRRPAGAAQS